MNARERFLRTMQFQSVDRVPYHELGIWGQTHERWFNEGLPRDVLHGNFFQGEEYFGMDRRDFIDIKAGMIPPFDPEVMEEDERIMVYRDERGITRRTIKEGTVRGTRPSMDQYLRFPVENRADFHELKKRYSPRSPVRYPPWWDDKVRSWKDCDYPLCLLVNAAFGFYSTPRQWMGTENLSVAFYDDPTLVHEMMDFLAEFFIETVRRAVEDVAIDYFNFFEDMAYKTAPLISPQMFREFMLPRYKRVIDFLRSHGVKIVIVDSDGNMESLIPLFLEAGVTGVWPLEIAAGMDPVKLRKEYGQDLTLSGGIDKRVLAQDRKAIEGEMLSKVPHLLEAGGYIPTVDHSVPPDVPYENFLYYLDLKEKIAEGRYGA